MILSTKQPPLLTITDEHGAPLAEYFHYPAEEILHVRWHGHLTAAEIIRGVQAGGRWRNELRYTRVLNDKTDTGGDWSEATPWLQYEWLPQALGAGIRAMAYVFSPRRENRFASQGFILAMRQHIAIEVFDDADAAYAWLCQQ